MRLDEKECFWIKSSFRMYVFFVFKEKLGCHSVVNLYRTELRFFFFLMYLNIPVWYHCNTFRCCPKWNTKGNTGHDKCSLISRWIYQEPM